MVDKVIVRYMGSLRSSVNSQFGFRQDCKVRNENRKRNRLRWVARSSHLAGAFQSFYLHGSLWNRPSSWSSSCICLWQSLTPVFGSLMFRPVEWCSVRSNKCDGCDWWTGLHFCFVLGQTISWLWSGGAGHRAWVGPNPEPTWYKVVMLTSNNPEL